MTALVALPFWKARAPRFLLLLLMVWVLLRVAAQTEVPMGIVAPIAAPAADIIAHRQRDAAGSVAAPHAHGAAPAMDLPMAAVDSPPSSGPGLPRSGVGPLPVEAIRFSAAAAFAPPPPGPGAWSSSDRHRWRFSMFDKWLTAQRSPHIMTFVPGKARLPAGQRVQLPQPQWPMAKGKNWSLSLYSFWRGGAAGAGLTVGDRPQALGGSQSGARLDYALDDQRRLRLFSRLTVTPDGPVQADAAIGAALRPLRRVPVDLIAERRFALTAQGSNATLVYAAGGVDEIPLAAGFTLSAYGQAGLVSAGKVRGFADAAAAIERPLGAERGLRLSAGAMAAGAVQPGAGRIDVGPRATLRLANIGEGARLSLDWRARVAGSAPPANGLALTLATGF